MHKFTVTYPEIKLDETKPVLYKIWFSSMPYLHKGKTLKDSCEKLLEDVFRGMRGLKNNPACDELVAYLKRNTSLYKVTIEVIMNDAPDKILKKEDTLWRHMKKHPAGTLNNISIPPYKPEWMLKDTLQKRCDACVTCGVIEGVETSFNFCPNCGRLNKPL